MAAMPAPDPTGLYCTEYPNADPRAGVQTETSGETNELPAPLIVVSLLLAPAAATASSANAATLMRASPLFIDVLSLSLGVFMTGDVKMPRIPGRVG